MVRNGEWRETDLHKNRPHSSNESGNVIKTMPELWVALILVDFKVN